MKESMVFGSILGCIAGIFLAYLFKDLTSNETWIDYMVSVSCFTVIGAAFGRLM